MAMTAGAGDGVAWLQCQNRQIMDYYAQTSGASSTSLGSLTTWLKATLPKPSAKSDLASVMRYILSR